MSYQVLARKWRPKNFSQVVGQQHVLTAISNALDQNKVHHAYLFSGTRGVGKTTIARIFAKSLNCINGVTSAPCGKCDNCISIDDGRFVDLLEIDAASRTKVDDTRELLDNVQYKPAIGKYKVYLIDEVHMLSKHSFNALLKTLEEPPEYVKFLLATTDPQKLPITVLSRCLQFHLKTIQAPDIEAQLSFILQQEQSTFEHSALSIIAKAADGSMRDALSLTDQALAFGSGHIAYQDVLKMLGTVDHQHLQYLLHFIVSGNVDKVFEKIEELVYLGADFGKLHQDLAALCHEIALNQLRPAKGDKHIQMLCDGLSPEEIQLYYQIATQGYKDYASAPSGKIAFEMTVMRLLAFKPASQIECPEPSMIKTAVTTKLIELPIEQVSEEPIIAPITQEAVNQPEDVVHTLPELQNEDVIASSKNIDLDTPIYEHAPKHQYNEQEQPLVTETQIESRQVTPVNMAQVENVIPEPVTQEMPITHSRNMLRSHREKREQAKKALATTENSNVQVAPAVVAKPEVAVNSVEKRTEAPQAINEQAFKHSNVVDEAKIETDSQQALNNKTINDQVTIPEQIAYEAVEEISTSNAMQDFIRPHYFNDQVIDHQEIDIAQYVSDKLTDPWSIAIKEMQLNGLVKLLAKNTVMKQVGDHISLTLKAAQQHLLNNPILGEQLETSIKAYYGEASTLYIEVGDVAGSLTAQESEFTIYERYLNKAKQSLVDDTNINQFVTAYGAKIFENSIIPL